MIKSRSSVSALLLAALMIVLPIQIGHLGVTLQPPSALAKDGGSGDNSGQGGGDESGHGSPPGSGGEHKSGSDDLKGGDDRSSSGTSRKDKHQLDRKYLYGAHGERIEIRGSSIAIIYPDGFKEAIRDGVLELTDPQGREVVRRPANGKDLSRIGDLTRF